MTPPRSRRLRLSLIIPLLLILLMAIVLVRTAWMSDDAYITLRTVDNFVNGHGLRWNPAERVQSFTHPLWMFLLSAVYFFTREAYFTTILISLFASLAAVLLVAFRIGQSTGGKVLALLVLLLSKAFIDYSSGGLENPLSHLLLVLLAFVYLEKGNYPKRLLHLSILTALVALNRLDLFLIASPFLIAAWRETGWAKGFRSVLLGVSPLVLWEVFSLVYYGVPFPNTAYAKLSTGLSQGALIAQSSWYYLQSLKIDPLTLTVIAAGVVIALVRRARGDVVMAVGTMLYLLYVAKIGGDFMGGRFFAAPLLVAAMIIVRIDFTPPKLRRLVPLFALLVVVLGFVSSKYGVLSGESFGSSMDRVQIHQDNGGVADERAYYYTSTGLLKYSGQTIWPNNSYIESGRVYRKTDKKIVFVSSVGFLGYYAGPGIYIYDPLALSDPLLSHLPVVQHRWRIGHGYRMAPPGYIESISNDTNRIIDSSLSAYYDVVRTLTRSPIFSFDRLKIVFGFNFGSYDHLIDYYCERAPERIPFDDIKLLAEEGLARPSQLSRLQQGGAIIYSPTRLFGKTISMLVDAEVDYELQVIRDNDVVAVDTLMAMDHPAKGRVWRFDKSEQTTQPGFDSLLVRPLYGRGNYWMGGVNVLP